LQLKLIYIIQLLLQLQLTEGTLFTTTCLYNYVQPTKDEAHLEGSRGDSPVCPQGCGVNQGQMSSQGQINSIFPYVHIGRVSNERCAPDKHNRNPR